MASISQVSADRAKNIVRLELVGGTTSQWLNAAPFATCFCISVVSGPSSWRVEGQLPDGELITLAHYRLSSGQSTVFRTGTPRYITNNVMCGLPIRFVSSEPQVGDKLWVLFKS